MLGDNFYGAMPGEVNSGRWIRHSEQMYPSSFFPGSRICSARQPRLQDSPAKWEATGRLWHIGKDAGVLYRFKKPLNITGRT